MRLVDERDPLGLYKGGGEIIRHFLDHEEGLDAVAVVAPRNFGNLIAREAKWRWEARTFCRKGLPEEAMARGTMAVVGKLPPPRFEGYQAKTICQQGGFAPQTRGWYRGTAMESRRDSVTVKMSTRLLQEFLAGRITKERFDSALFGDGKNLFEHWLALGFTLDQVSMEAGGLDQDDDTISLRFKKDPAASPLESRACDSEG